MLHKYAAKCQGAKADVVLFAPIDSDAEVEFTSVLTMRRNCEIQLSSRLSHIPLLGQLRAFLPVVTSSALPLSQNMIQFHSLIFLIFDCSYHTIV
ncbi:hypothetical protein IF2G_04560 [Cordyceps javanica]|nr:hypothetical protein IF2G_04560 [Cordyceps javanica]